MVILEEDGWGTVAPATSGLTTLIATIDYMPRKAVSVDLGWTAHRTDR